MAIKALGESLLSSAKKKAKRGQKLGQLAGLAMVGMSIANSNIRKKAMTRYNEWNNSLTPVKKALDKDFYELGLVKSEYNKRSGHSGGELESFIEDKMKLLKSINATVPKGLAPPDDAAYRKIAEKEALPEYEEYKQRVAAYQPLFSIADDKDTYYQQYNNLNKLTSAELKNDNLMELLGNKTGWGKNTQQIATEIVLANGQKTILNIPANILEKFDTDYFDKIGEISERATTTQEIKNKRAITLNEQAKSRDAKALIISVTPKPSAVVPIDKEVDEAWSTVSEEFIGQGKNMKSNPDYVGKDFYFKDKKDEYETTYSLKELLGKLDDINFESQLPFKDTELSGISNRDVLINKAKEYTQLLVTDFKLNGQGVLDNIKYESFMRKGLEKALLGVTIKTDPGFFYDGVDISLSYAPVNDNNETPEVPQPIIMMRETIQKYQNDPRGMPNELILDLPRLIKEFPEYKDEFSVYLPEEKEETPPPSPTPTPTPSPTPAPTPAPTTSKSLLSMDEEEVMSSAAADKAREEAAEIPGQVVEGVINVANRNRINNLEKDLERVKDNKRPIMMLNSSMRDYLEENYNVTSLRTLSKPDKIKAIEELIELLKS